MRICETEIHLIQNSSCFRIKNYFQARLIVGSILSPAIIVLGLLIGKQYHDSGRLIFRTVGASSEDQAMCKTMFFFYGLLKFDLQLGVSILHGPVI